MPRASSWVCDKVHLEALLLALVLLGGIVLRYIQLMRALDARLDPDVIGYLTIARRIISGNFDFIEPSQGGLMTREPLYPLVLAFSLWVSSPTSGDVIARVTSAVISVFVIPATYLLARRLFDSYVALFASVLVAFNGILVILSSRGLRDDMASLILLLFILSVYGVGNGRDDRARSVRYLCVASILSVLLVVTRWEMLPIAIVVAVLLLAHPSTRSLKDRLRASMAIACSSLIGLAIDVTIAIAAGVDPFGHSRAQASWLFWYEFSRDYSTTYIQQGIWISMYDYLFRYHTLGQLVFYELRGIRFLLEHMNAAFFPYALWNSNGFVDFHLFMNEYLYPSYPILAAFPIMAYIAVLGLVHVLLHGKSRLLVLPLLLPTFLYCFMYGVINVGDSIRYVAIFLPIIFITTSVFLVGIVRALLHPFRLTCSGNRLKACLRYCVCMITTVILITLVLVCV